MSTIKLENIQHPDSSTPAISLDSSGGMSGSFPYPNRNLIYNGAMQVAQRGTSVVVAPNGYNTVDRWEQASGNTTSVYTQSVENDAPVGSGFAKSCKMLVTTANASPAAAAQRTFRQKLEGQDCQRIAKGTASAQQLTLSFWVKSNVTGTFVCELYDSDNVRSVSASYTISASATWEKKVLTFPADATGSLDNDNAASLWCFFGLEAGSNFTSGSLQTTWGALTNANRYVGQTNVAASVNNYWQITGVQLETGPVATEFEHEPYGVTLAKCQRYCYRFGPGGTYAAIGSGRANSTTICYPFSHIPVTMRTTPTELKVNGNISLNLVGVSATAVTSLAIAAGNSSPSVVGFTANVASGLTNGVHYDLASNNDTTAYVLIGAEL